MSGDDIRALRRSATRGARWTGASTVVRVIVQVAQLAVLARLLEPSDFGLMSLAGVAVAFGQAFGDFGLSNAIIHYQDATRRELSSLYWVNLFAGVAVFAILWACAPLLVHVFHDAERLPPIVRVVALVFVLIPLGQQFQVLLERDLHFRRLAVVEMTANVAGAAAGIGGALRGMGVWALVASLLVTTTVRSLLLVASGWSRWRPSAVFDPRACGRFLRFGAWQMGERSLNMLGQQLDRIIIGATMSTTQLGYYDLAWRLVIRPYQILSPVFTRVAFPVFSRVQHDLERVRKGFLEMIEVVSTAMGGIYGAIAALAAPYVLLQLSGDYGPTIVLVRILAGVGFLFAVGTPMGSVLLALGRPDVGTRLNALRTALFAAVIAAGARHGAVGVAVAILVAMVVVMVPVGFAVRARVMRLAARPYLAAVAPAVVVPFVAAMAGHAASMAVLHRMGATGSAAAAASMFAGGLGYAIVWVGWMRARWPHRLRRIVTLART